MPTKTELKPPLRVANDLDLGPEILVAGDSIEQISINQLEADDAEIGERSGSRP